MHTFFIVEHKRARFTGGGKALKAALRCPGVRPLCGPCAAFRALCRGDCTVLDAHRPAELANPLIALPCE